MQRIKDAMNPHKMTVTHELTCHTGGVGTDNLITASSMICLLLNCDSKNVRSQPNISALLTKSLVQPAHGLYKKIY